MKFRKVARGHGRRIAIQEHFSLDRESPVEERFDDPCDELEFESEFEIDFDFSQGFRL